MKRTSFRLISEGFFWLSVIAPTLAAGCRSYQLVPTPETTLSAESTATKTNSTHTPDPCTGWTYAVEGVVFAQSPNPGNELARIILILIHSSNCSPTQGHFQAVTNIDGSYGFPEIFFHNADRLRILVEQEGYASWTWDSAGQYCSYYTCFNQPIQAVLQPEEIP